MRTSTGSCLERRAGRFRMPRLGQGRRACALLLAIALLVPLTAAPGAAIGVPAGDAAVTLPGDPGGMTRIQPGPMVIPGGVAPAAESEAPTLANEDAPAGLQRTGARTITLPVPAPDGPMVSEAPGIAATTELFNDGFESWPGPWYTGGDPTWGQTSYRASTGTYSAYCVGSSIPAPGPYPNDAYAWMIAGPLDLSGYTEAILAYDLWLDAEMDYDGIFVGVSDDGGSFDITGYTGTPGDWIAMEEDLSDFYDDGTLDLTGEPQVWIAFIFDSDESFTYEGVYVDNVRVTAGGEPSVNTPPVGVADSYSTNQDQQLVVPAPGVLGNDTDADGDPLTAYKLTDPSHGSVTLGTSGGFTYTPTTGYHGSDSFTYRAYDGTDYSASVTVIITVNAPPEPVSLPFAHGFETWPGPWTTLPGSGPTWGRTTYRKTAGTYSAYCVGSSIAAPGPYPNDAETWMIAGPFDLSDADVATVSFDLWIKTELDYDGMMLGASTDGVNYDVTGWSGDSGGWEYGMEVDLSDLRGDGGANFTGEPAVWVAFIFSSDVDVTDEGAYVDNVEITAEAAEPPLPPVLNVAGPTRYETAVEASKLAFPDGAPAVVIATGMNWPDALGGSALAGALGGPILLTDPRSLPSVVSSEITRLKASRAIILGGTSAVSTAVEDALKRKLGSGAGIVTRIAGNDRYDTANKVARRVMSELGAGYDGRAFVATGGNFPDALAAAPLAAAKGWPLFLSNPATGISPATRTAMNGVTDVVILGGTSAVPATVKTSLEGWGFRTTRVSGANRYDTAVKIATYGVNNAGLRWNRVGIATGENYPDALAGGVLQGAARSVMLLTTCNRLCTDAGYCLLAKRAEISTVTFFGGTTAVSSATRADVAACIAGTWTPPQPPPTSTDGIWRGYKSGYSQPVVSFNVKNNQITTSGSTLEHGASMIVVYPYSNVTLTWYVYATIPINSGSFSYTQGTPTTMGGQKSVSGKITSATAASGTASHTENSFGGFTGSLSYSWTANR